MSEQPSDGTEHVLYLTTLLCGECGNSTTYAHEGPNVPLDQDPPWPDDVQICPECGTYYPDDLGIAVEEVTNAERVDPHSLQPDTERSEDDDLVTDGGRPGDGVIQR